MSVDGSTWTYNEEQAVEAGIALLDARGPSNWDEQINLPLLDVMTTWNCVLGQLYGTYEEGKEVLGLAGGARYGFAGGDNSYFVLNQVWHDKITARRAARLTGFEVDVDTRELVAA